MVDDTHLVLRALKGERDKYGELVEKYQKPLLGLAFSYVQNYQNAQDIVQDALIVGYRQLASLRQPHRFDAWIRQITINISKSHLRKQRRNQQQSDCSLLMLSADGDLSAVPEANVETKHRQNLIQKALAGLNPKHREVIVLHHILNYSAAEIAAILGVTANTVYVRLSRGRKALQRELINVFEDDLHMLGCEAHLYLQRLTEEIKKKLAAENPREQREAAGQLRLTAARANHSRLLADLAADNSKIRLEAAEIIGQTEEKRLIPPLLERLSLESEPNIQIRIIQSLVELEAVEAVPVLEELQRQTIHMDVHKQCGKAVRCLADVKDSKPRAVPITTADLRDAGLDQIMIQMLEETADPVTMISLLDGLGRLGTAKPLKKVCDLLLKVPYPQVRRQAAITLGQIGTSSAFIMESLLKAVLDQDWTVVDAAVKTLADLTPKEQTDVVIHALLDVFWDSLSKPFPVRFTLAAAVAKLADRELKWADELLPRVIQELENYPAKAEYQKFHASRVLCGLVADLIPPGFNDLNEKILNLLNTNKFVTIPPLLLALGYSKDAECIATISTYLSYEAPDRRYEEYGKQVRESAVRALMNIGEAGWPRLREALMDSGTSDHAKLSILDVWQKELSLQQIAELQGLDVRGNARFLNKWQLLLRKAEISSIP